MSLLVTDALVLHAFDYLETSRIYRLLTREAGVQSVLARGARRTRSRYGSAVDLFAEGEAQLSVRPTRELQTLTAFDVTRARPELGASLDRFTAAAVIAELALRFVRDDAQPALYDVVRDAFDAIARAPDHPGQARDAALCGAWHLVAELGFAPSIDTCSACRTPVLQHIPATFGHATGGILCATCASGVPVVRSSRLLPTAARDALRAWMAGDAWTLGADTDGRAHQRLLREFLGEHLTDGRVLRAFDVWERGEWGRIATVPGTEATAPEEGVS